MKLPLNEWQFWAVTLAGAGALLWLARGLLPARLLGMPLRRKGVARKATLTIKGKRPGV